jgi:small subunit ribosomal protein S17
MSEVTETTESARGHRKVREGKVVSAGMNKTIVVQIERRSRHALYGKEIRKSKKLYAHDEENQAKVGDTVKVMETRPLSKTKHWRLLEIVQH